MPNNDWKLKAYYTLSAKKLYHHCTYKSYTARITANPFYYIDQFFFFLVFCQDFFYYFLFIIHLYENVLLSLNMVSCQIKQSKEKVANHE